MKTRLLNLALLFSVLIAGFAAMEWLVRRLPAAERLGWNLVQPVAQRVEQFAAKGQSHRIIVAGDSFAEWMEQSGGNFARIAESSLRRQGRDVAMLNMGEAGSGLADYYRNLVTYGPDIKPGTVVIAVYLGNDLSPFPGGLPAPDQLHTRLPQPNVPRGWRDLLKQSVLLNLVYRQAKLHIPWIQSGFTAHVLDYSRSSAGKDQAFVTERLARVDPQLLRDANSDAINGWDLAAAIFRPDYYDNLAKADTATAEGEAARAALVDLRVLYGYVRSLGATPVLVLIPPSPWVDSRYHDYFQRLGYGRLGLAAGAPLITGEIMAMAQGDGVAVLDLLPVLRASDQPAYLERDIHFNSHGQKLAGQALANFLRSLLP
ncbi:conserved protein of unknown function [Magnetospirillum gryphiswaldense MSR-1 v2]|uniref:SGNH hydrolase-type esterase domain-containing protein n=1 Tax=Magnetospirillum gryphiswaldense (strain DSM 6361 / JCM 21280 / NBRC 15271 / MSR-1) TaxID=431944 RepID=V6F884_MAGGM|nr:hypothetical protein [Magnetospirillum gryphiswaldense]CDL00581.1 conserved protein of unknown function [Magnetospirillum gryphiswaldense MSR-1 v2]